MTQRAPAVPAPTVSIALTLNGGLTALVVPATQRLIELLRDTFKLTGTHGACETGQCGACTVLVNGEATKSCSVLAASCNGDEITTIEGLSRDGYLHPMQLAFREHHGLQCGFCTPGMIMVGVDIVRRLGSDVSAATVRRELDGNLCRCTGYDNIVKAILAAANGTIAQDGPAA